MWDMTNPTLVAATIAVWTAAFGATGAYAHWMQPTQPTVAATTVAQPSLAAEVAQGPPLDTPEMTTIVMPTVEIVSHVARGITSHEHARDVPDVKCSPPRPLEQGSNYVQVCE